MNGVVTVGQAQHIEILTKYNRMIIVYDEASYAEAVKLSAELRSEGKLKEISEKFHISLRAVNSHKTNIFNKLGISSSVEMVRFALEHGII